MCMGFDIPFLGVQKTVRPGFNIPSLGSQKTMCKRVQYTMGKGNTIGKGFTMPWVGVRYSMGRGKIPLLGSLIYHE